MTTRKIDRRPADAKSVSRTGPPVTDKEMSSTWKALPKASGRPDTGQPGGGQGRVDVTGTMPEGIRVDPNLTEGHPGYQESGDSEIIPAERFRGGEVAEHKGPFDSGAGASSHRGT